MLPLFAGLAESQLWYAAPLVVAISLVYAGTRHELMGPILWHAFRAGVWIVAFMVIVFVVLALMLRQV
jgi:hypothetical protein